MTICRCLRTRFVFLLPVIVLLPLLLSVSNLHQKPSIEVPKRLSSNKSNHLVLGPAAGEGLPDRLQCQGLKAMNRLSLPSLHHHPNDGKSVSFVTVFTVYNSSQRLKLESITDNLQNSLLVGATSHNKIERSIAILNTFINFAQISMPNSKIFLLTDPAAEFSDARNNVKLIPIPGDYSRWQLMLQRMRSYITFLETLLQQNCTETKQFHNYIFTDSDVAVVGDLGHIFENYPNFHIALTFRNNRDQPLNSGFIAVRGTPDGIINSKVFLEEVLEVYRSKYVKASGMLGDQLALAWVVRSHLSFANARFRKPEAFYGTVNRTIILFLPCAIYNWTPPEGAGQFHGMPLDVQVVHFKGSRKRLMLESWSYFNKTSSLPDMLCLILRSGRSKYDF
ncbi:hypothetical protein HPP92_002493 [Vanilla planifolia]|uniref:Uncharacterized protein n=1 Tax=Vanilla planifolia TaxID=51239 RepID=A0A835VMU0_VANPL|nr:hypothetical protein HPP92_002493 [Vanilla planifolia]